MTTDRFDRVLPQLFDELAEPRTPDYLEAAIEAASSRPQRPAWTFPGRWLPMQISTSATPVARVPWRQIGVLAVIGILIAVAVVAAGIAASRRPQYLPAQPYGLAQNGSIAIAVDGDIATVDPSTGAIADLIAGPETDSMPVFSPDGTQLAFQRTLDGGVSVIMAAAADGTGLRQVTPEPLSLLPPWSFSPDGRDLLVTAMVDGRMRLLLQPVAGGSPTTIDVRLPIDPERVEPATFRPPLGREILFLATDVTTMRGLYVFDRETGETRVVVAPVPGTDLFGATWSPDGETITFHRYDATGDGISARLFAIGADGTGERPVGTDPGTAFELQTSPVSNDGTRVVVHREPEEGPSQSFVRSLSGDSEPVILACGDAVACPNAWFWSPDDTQLLGVIEGSVTRYAIADPRTGAMEATDWSGSGEPAWQRTGGLVSEP